MKKFELKKYIIFVLVFSLFVVFGGDVVNAEPLDSPNYRILDTQIGPIGEIGNSTNYSILSNLSPISDPGLQSTSYALKAGFPNGIMANVPKIVCFEATSSVTTNCQYTGVDPNPAIPMTQICGTPGCYNRAKLEIDDQDNPYDALYLVEISPDNFTTVYYLRSSHYIDTTYSINDYMTQCNLEGIDPDDLSCTPNASLQQTNIYGLDSSTTYSVRVRALHGNFTESLPSPVSTATTESPSLIFDLDVAATDSESSAPYAINFGYMQPNLVTTATNRIWLDLGTNWNSGASVYNYDLYNGMYSTSSTGLIPSQSEDLFVDSGGDGGFGLRALNASQTALGPLLRDSIYYNASQLDYVGAVDNASPYSRIFYTENIGSNRGPITAGRGEISVKVKPISSDPTASDYTDEITFIVSPNL